MIFLFLSYAFLGIIILLVTFDMNKQIKAYERKEKQHGETISQITPASKENNKMASERTSGKSKRSRSKGEKDIKSNKS